MKLNCEQQKSRLLAELAAINLYNQEKEEPFRIRLARNGTIVRGELSLQPKVNRYRVRFTLGDDYPASPPGIEILEPSLPPGVPHLLGGNHPCLFYAGGYSESRWNPSTHTAVFALLCCWRWLLCLDLWVTTGRWAIPDAGSGSGDNDQPSQDQAYY